MAELTELSQEIDRVVSAPYVPSLKPLHDIVKYLPTEILREWAYFKSCQVTLLAAALRESLELGLSPFRLELVKRCVEILPLRNAILAQEPSMLNKWIVQALHAHEKEGSSLMEDICVTTLSYPLPDNFALPNALQNFTEKLLETAARRSSTASLRAVYRLFNGTRTILLDTVPESNIKSFILECQHALRSLNDQVSPLLCLAIFAQIVNSCKETTLSSPEPTKDPVQIPRIQEVCREVFDILNGRHTSKTLDLTVMHAIICCSDGKNITTAEAMERLQLIKEILVTIEPSRKVHWTEAHWGRIQKFCEKIVRPGIEFDVQLMALSACAALVSVREVPDTLLDLSVSIVLHRQNIGFGPNAGSALASVLDWILPVLLQRNKIGEESADTRQFNATAYMQKAVDLCRPGQRLTSDLFRNLRHFLQITQCFLSASATSTEICEMIATKAALELIPGWWDLDLCPDEQEAPEHSSCTKSSICPNAIGNLRTELAIFVSSLIAQATCLVAFEAAERTCVAKGFTKLFSLLRVGETRLRCEPSPGKLSRRADVLYDFTVTGVESDAGASLHWREKLRQELINSASSDSVKVANLVGSICRDLEDRCNTVEKPLREAVAECAQLTNEVATATNRNMELQTALDKLSVSMESVSAEKMRAESQLDNSSDKLASSTRDIERLEAQLELERSTAGKKAEEAAVDELGRRTLVAVLEEKVSCKDVEVADLEDEVKTLKGALLCSESERKQLYQKALDTERSYDGRIQSMKEESVSISANMENKLRAIQNRLDEADDELRNRTEISANREHDLQAEVDRAQARENETYINFRNQLHHVRSAHGEELRSMKATMEAVERRAKLDRESYDSQVKSLERRLTDNAKKRKSQAQELKEEREFKRRLLHIIHPLRDTPRITIPSEDLTTVSPLLDNVMSNLDTVQGLAAHNTFKSSPSKASLHENFESNPSTDSSPSPKPIQALRSSSALSFREPGRTSTPQNSPGARRSAVVRDSLGAVDINSIPMSKLGVEFPGETEGPNYRKAKLSLEGESLSKENSILPSNISQAFGTDSSIDENELADF